MKSDPFGKQSLGRQGLLQEILASQIYRIWLVLCIMIVSVAVLLPSKPDILTNFFASERAGRRVSCEDFTAATEPEYCRNAHSDAVWWGSFSDFFSNSIVAFLLAPLAGRWSDRYGRKKFIGLFLFTGTLAPLVMALHISSGLSLYYYFPAQAFSGHNGMISLCSAYISDKISPENRAAAMGLNLAGFMAAFICGPLIGGVVTTSTAAWMGVGGTLTATAFLWLFVPESLSQAARDKATHKQKAESRWEQAPWNSLNILLRTKLYTQLAVIVCIAGFVAQGFMELLAQYLQLKLKYGKIDLMVVMVLAGSTGFIAQTLVMRAFLLCMGECAILLIRLRKKPKTQTHQDLNAENVRHNIIPPSLGIAARFVEQVVLCIAWSRAVVIIAICFGAIATLMMPVSIALLSKNVAIYEQGTAQGALYGVLALSQGLGPLAFAFLFSGFTRSDSTWPFIPGAPYLFGAALMILCGILALLLDRSAEEGLQDETLYQEMAMQPNASGGLSLTPAPSMLQRAVSSRLSGQKSSSLGTQKSASLGRQKSSTLGVAKSSSYGPQKSKSEDAQPSSLRQSSV